MAQELNDARRRQKGRNARNTDCPARRPAGGGGRRDRRTHRRRRGPHRRARRGCGVSRCPAIARALPVQAGDALHPGRGGRGRGAQRARRCARQAGRPSGRADDAVRRDGRSRCAATRPGVHAARLGVVRGRRRAAVQRPHHASRVAHARPVGRRRDRAGARRRGRHRYVDLAAWRRPGALVAPSRW